MAKKPHHGNHDDKIVRIFKNTFATSGELVVVGHGSVTFEIMCKDNKHHHKYHNEWVRVGFVDCDPLPVPCSTHEPDMLWYDLQPHRGHHCLLTISWRVHHTRAIAWTVKNQ